MRKFLSIAGAVFLLLIVGLGGMFGWLSVKGSKLDAESAAYIQTTLPRALAHASGEDITSFMAADDRKSIQPGALDTFYAYMSMNLGTLTSCDAPKGSSLLMALNGTERITAQYLDRCQFSKANVTAKVTLRKIGEAWSLVGVYFDPASLEVASEGGAKPSQRT